MVMYRRFFVNRNSKTGVIRYIAVDSSILIIIRIQFKY